MTERQYGHWWAAAARNTRTAGREREPQRGPWSGFVTLPLVGVLVLGLFAFSVALFPPGPHDHDTATAASDTDGAPERSPEEPVRRGTGVASRKEEARPAEETGTEGGRSAGPAERRELPAEETGPEVTAVVHFSHNGTELTYEGIVALQRFAERAVAAEAAWVRIDGYGDDTGTPEANLRVSLQRAEETAAFLQERMPVEGIDFVTAGHGAADPVADNSTVEGRARNRRIEATAGTGAPGAGRSDRGVPPADEERDDVAGVPVPQVERLVPGGG
ncbi:OmpA family protein [Thermobifida alba]|uniref:OmpA family protein n=1 Tax=Thermobifida alba TaxID=53522 RepID=UPI0020BD595A|nr:OmpA family protein [Thermobifida alba]